MNSKEYMKKYSKQYRLKNKEKLKQQSHNWYLKDIDRIKQKIKENYYNNKEKHLKYSKQYRLKNKDKLIKYSHNWYLKNIDKVKQGAMKNFFKNKIKIYEKHRKRLKEDLNYKLKADLSRNILSIIKNYKGKKLYKTIELLGCNINELKQYLEKQFKLGMNWSNHTKNGWHIDHIVPCCKFDLTKKEEQLKCFHYSNLQPLWWYENLSKGGK